MRTGIAEACAPVVSRPPLPRSGPRALYRLLFTIVILFAGQGDRITSHPLDVARIALPLLA